MMWRWKGAVLGVVLALAGAGTAGAGSVRVAFEHFDFTCIDDIWEIEVAFERYTGGVSLNFVEKGMNTGYVEVTFTGSEFSPAKFAEELRRMGFSASLAEEYLASSS